MVHELNFLFLFLTHSRAGNACEQYLPLLRSLRVYDHQLLWSHCLLISPGEPCRYIFISLDDLKN